ncbi:MAG: hypothetical protein MMC33_003734 [Icmadophila ericetorum]|nr:hypothetical protein [Icmadophila ericetorum]
MEILDAFYTGVDPPTYDDARKFMEKMEKLVNGENSEGRDKIFTLIDTGTMAVALLAAQRPLGALLLCGEEGGIQRALLCSYDWQTRTMYRDIVLGMDTTVVDRMHYVPRVRLGLRRTRTGENNASQQSG